MNIIAMTGHGHIGQILSHFKRRQQVRVIDRRPLRLVDGDGPTLIKVRLTKILNDLPLKKLNSLKKLNLTYSESTDVTLDALESLEELRVEYSTFNTLSLENLENLQKLEFSMSGIETLVLKNLKNIRDLNLESFLNLKHVVFEGDFSMLKSLTFTNLQDLESIEGLKSLNHLKSLKISSTKKLTSLDLDGVNHDLEFSVRNSGLTRGSIRGFEALEERQVPGFRF